MTTAYIDLHQTPPDILLYSDKDMALAVIRGEIWDIVALDADYSRRLPARWAILIDNPDSKFFDTIYADAIRRK